MCGRARGYQKGVTDSFWGYHGLGQTTVDGYYLDGLSITYGSPRQHIWTYAVGAYDNRSECCWNCLCAVGGLGSPSPPFVGANFYCESGAISTYDRSVYYFNDTLWDGSDCYSSTSCCSNPRQPWFYRNLNDSTTSNIEARICRIHSFSVGTLMVDQLELYVQ